MALKAKLAAVGLVVVAVAGCGSSKINYRATAATGDVKISSCRVSSEGVAIAQLKVTNHSSRQADYVTTVAFTANGSTTRSGPGFEGGVGSGKSVVGQVTGTTPLPTTTKLTCQVSSVSRTPSTLTSLT